MNMQCLTVNVVNRRFVLSTYPTPGHMDQVFELESKGFYAALYAIGPRGIVHVMSRDRHP
jgi:hypothetical protein